MKPGKPGLAEKSLLETPGGLKKAINQYKEQELLARLTHLTRNS